jgi:hypothetical protein
VKAFAEGVKPHLDLAVAVVDNAVEVALGPSAVPFTDAYSIKLFTI